jgi:hypothetical protein
MNRGRVGEERRGKETDRCPLTLPKILDWEEFLDQALESLDLTNVLAHSGCIVCVDEN